MRPGVGRRPLHRDGGAADPAGTPRVSLTAVRMARKRMYFSAAQAVRELGLPQTDVREALRDAVAVVRRSTGTRPSRRMTSVGRGA